MAKWGIGCRALRVIFEEVCHDAGCVGGELGVQQLTCTTFSDGMRLASGIDFDELAFWMCNGRVVDRRQSSAGGRLAAHKEA